MQILDVQMRPGYAYRIDNKPPKNVTRIHIETVGEFPKVLQDAIKPWVMGGV